MAENNRKSLKIWYDEFEIAHDAFDYNEDDCKEFSYWITQFFMGKWYECKRKRVKTYVKYNLKRLEFVTKQKLNGEKGGLQSAENKEVKPKSLASTLPSVNASDVSSTLASLTTTITKTITDTETIKLPFDGKEFQEAWSKWKIHKHIIGDIFHISAEKEALKNLFNESGEDVNLAIKSIEKSISNTYKGIFIDKPKPTFKPKEEQTTNNYRRARKEYKAE